MMIVVQPTKKKTNSEQKAEEATADKIEYEYEFEIVKYTYVLSDLDHEHPRKNCFKDLTEEKNQMCQDTVYRMNLRLEQNLQLLEKTTIY